MCVYARELVGIRALPRTDVPVSVLAAKIAETVVFNTRLRSVSKKKCHLFFLLFFPVSIYFAGIISQHASLHEDITTIFSFFSIPRAFFSRYVKRPDLNARKTFFFRGDAFASAIWGYRTLKGEWVFIVILYVP